MLAGLVRDSAAEWFEVGVARLSCGFQFIDSNATFFERCQNWFCSSPMLHRWRHTSTSAVPIMRVMRYDIDICNQLSGPRLVRCDLASHRYRSPEVASNSRTQPYPADPPPLLPLVDRWNATINLSAVELDVHLQIQRKPCISPPSEQIPKPYFSSTLQNPS